MKTTVLLFSVLLFSTIVYGQNLEGHWNGTFSGFNYLSGEHKLFLDFYKIDDTTFQVLNTTVDVYGDTAISLMKGNFYEKNKLHLVEIKIIKDYPGTNTKDCMRTFELFYIERKKRITLDGKWYANYIDCGSGLVFLKKQL
jgi:hypothetical protein